MRDEYREVEYEKFRKNLNSLRKAYKKNYHDKAIVDSAAVAHDRLVHPRLPIITNQSGFSYSHWDGLESKNLLKLDIRDGKQDIMVPQKLRETREEYQGFPLEVFRKHIHQEVHSNWVTAYWLATRTSK